jgi:hypothetical protein
MAFVALGVVFAFNGTLVNVGFAALIAGLRGVLGSQRSFGAGSARCRRVVHRTRRAPRVVRRGR